MSGRTLLCASHGRVPWEGHVVCNGCNTVYQTEDEEKPHFAPEDCKCGLRLMPDADKEKTFSARSICADCFKSRTQPS